MTFRTLPDTDQLPHALYTAEQVRGFDRMAIERFGIPGLTLMERAGQAAFDLIRYRWPSVWTVMAPSSIVEMTLTPFCRSRANTCVEGWP